MIRRYGFRQREIKQGRVCETQTSSKKKRYVNTPAAQYAAKCRAKDEPETESCAEQSHSLGPILLGRDVGDVSLRSGDVAAGNAVENSAHEKHPESPGKAKNQKADSGADDRNQKN